MNLSTNLDLTLVGNGIDTNKYLIHKYNIALNRYRSYITVRYLFIGTYNVYIIIRTITSHKYSTVNLRVAVKLSSVTRTVKSKDDGALKTNTGITDPLFSLT